MRRELLELTPTRFLCPYCGEWHDWSNVHWRRGPDGTECFSSKEQIAQLRCSKLGDIIGLYEIYFYKDTCHYYTQGICWEADQSMRGDIPISFIIESDDKPIVTFEVPFTAVEEVGHLQCYDECTFVNHCNCVKLGDAGDHLHMTIRFGFEFKKDDYDRILNREDTTTMEKTTKTTQTTIWEQLYKHSPEENVEILKEWSNKYKPTLKWAVPVLSIYAAYRILNSKDSNLTIENIDVECEKKLGFSLDHLKDKKSLSELMILGGLTAGAYAAIKAVSAIYKKDDETDVSVEEIEAGMKNLDGVAKKFKWIQPRTEAMLPIATSVIIVYVMTQKPKWFEDVKEKANKFSGKLSIRASVYLEMAKLFIADKLNIDLNNEEEAQKFKKFALLGGVVGIGALVYGKKIFEDKVVSENGDGDGERNEKLKAFISQLLSIMESLLPTAFAGATTFLVTKHVLKAKEDVVYVEANEESSEETEKTDHTSTKEVDEE